MKTEVEALRVAMKSLMDRCAAAAASAFDTAELMRDSIRFLEAELAVSRTRRIKLDAQLTEAQAKLACAQGQVDALLADLDIMKAYVGDLEERLGKEP